MGKLKIKTKMCILLVLMMVYAILSGNFTSHALDAMTECGSAEATKEMASSFLMQMITGSTILVVIFAVLGIWITIDIVRTLDQAVGYALRLAEGDMRQDIPEKYLMRKDSIGDLAKSFKKIHDNMSQLIGTIQKEVKNLEDVVVKAEENVKGISDEIVNVSASTQQISAGMQQTASSAQEVDATSAEIETVARNIAVQAENGAQRVVDIHERANDTKRKSTENRKHTNEVHQQIQ